MDDLIGLTLKGKFEITGRLGEGAMGTVFRGVDKETAQDVAIKVMHPSLMKEPGMLTRFRREAKAMRRVKHENAVQVLGHGVDQGWVFLAMELIEGQDLAEHMATHGRLAPGRAARIVAEVCSALAEAHGIGLVHRDVKPENVLLGKDGESVKLTDFGIAKEALMITGGAADDEESFDDSVSMPDSSPFAGGFELTNAGTLVGSPGYMAPEQWGSRPVDARTDVYACGVMLYQLVTGRLPFEAENPFMVAAMQLQDTPLAPHVRNPKVPRSLSALILRALRPAPEDRFQSASELRDALRANVIENAIDDVIETTIALDRTVPFQIPDAAPRALAFPKTAATTPAPVPAPAPVIAPAPTPAPAPVIPATLAPVHPAAATVILDADAEITTAIPVRSTGRNGRTTPIPLEPSVSLARVSNPPLMKAHRAAAQVRVLIPLAAAFLALGVVLGILLFFPAL